MIKNITKTNIVPPIAIGTGLIALDVVMIAGSDIVQFYAGGSCGNVLTILSYLGWSAFPISRQANNVASELLSKDLKRWKIHEDLITYTSDGSTPIIIHRIMKDKNGTAKHRFEFKNPEDGTYLPSYKPFLAKDVNRVVENDINPRVFYFDRINRASIDLAKKYKIKGATIIFEPSSLKDEKNSTEALNIADVIKFATDRIPDYDDLFNVGRVPLEIKTLGENGLMFRKQGKKKWTFVPGFQIGEVVDTAGAGDWCTAGLINDLIKTGNQKPSQLSDQVITESLRISQAMSALNCKFEGARGLMYAVEKAELLDLVNRLVLSKGNKMPSPVIQKTIRPQLLEKSISSLME